MTRQISGRYLELDRIKDEYTSYIISKTRDWEERGGGLYFK